MPRLPLALSVLLACSLVLACSDSDTPDGTDAGMQNRGGAGDGDPPQQDAGPPGELERFSFFVTSLAGLQRLSKDPLGFGGDLRYGQAHGLTGADKICSELAESSQRGSSRKTWRAFLSAVRGPDGEQVNAIDRIGEGPWYDRTGRIVARNPAALLHDRPQGADPEIIDDLPNEYGIPNHAPDPGSDPVDNHHMLTGTDDDGTLHNEEATCADWSSTARSAGQPRVGFAWPSDTRRSWLSQMDEAGCLRGVNVDQEVSPDPDNPTVGSGGGYGGFYCFALTP